jgi:hypothetical protein
MAKRKSAAKNIMLDPILVVKGILVFFILISPFINYRFFLVANNIFIKVLLVVLIFAACFIDFQLALIATIAFMILIINLNNNILMTAVDTFIDQYFEKPVTIPADVDQTQNLANVACRANQEKRNDINNDMLSFFIDDKIKPYEVFISMMTNEENLQKAQGDHL